MKGLLGFVPFTPGTPDISQEFRVCICVYARAWQYCSLQSAFSGLHRGEEGESLQLCRPLSLCDCLVCTRFEPSSRLSPPSHICKFAGNLFSA